MRIALWIAGTAALLFALDRLLLRLEKRGYIYYRRRKASPGTVGSAVLEVHALFEPGRRHVVEERQREPDERPAPDGPPET
jgi:hypothetical protein